MLNLPNILAVYTKHYTQYTVNIIHTKAVAYNINGDFSWCIIIVPKNIGYYHILLISSLCSFPDCFISDIMMILFNNSFKFISFA